MSHAITVTKVADETSDDVEYAVGGEHDSSCQVYHFCGECDGDESITDDMRDDWAADGVFERHGKTHIIMDMGDIGVLSTECAVENHPDLWLLAEDAGIGTHEIACGYWGGGLWEITVMPVSTDSGEQR